MATYQRTLGGVTLTLESESATANIYYNGTEFRATVRAIGETPGGKLRDFVDEDVALGSWPGGGTSKTFAAHLSFGLDAALQLAGYTAV